MARALGLARRAQGRVEPNPMVGAVVVREDARGRQVVVGEGYHQQYGGPHAEVHALAAAGKKARGATLYVTLEPCCHWGKTPPCTDAILASGVGRVVVAMIDPFAQVRGRGAALLRRAGVRVEVGLMEAEAKAMNAPFVTRLSAGRPFVIAKWAQSLDGCIATASGESRWISSEASRELVQRLRGRVDAVIVGSGTALADDPLLTARPRGERDVKRIATRVVVDSTCRLPLSSRLVKTVWEAPVLVAHRRGLTGAAEARRKALAAGGVMTVPLAADAAGRVRVSALLKYLGAMEYTNVLVEGGGELLASCLLADVVDEAHVFMAPIVIGGAGARHAVGGPDLKKLSQAHRMDVIDVGRCGADVHVVLRRA